jgi:uncharacterized lipoprotein YmbA
MMTRFSSTRKLLWPFLLLWIVAGCTGTSPPSTFYLLSAVPESDRSMELASGAAPPIVLGPVTLPAYLDRTQIVTRAGDSELHIDEFHRWGEPLKDAVYRVLQENLSVMLGRADIYTYPQAPRTIEAVQVIIDVIRFDIEAGGDAVLVAFWSIANERDGFPSEKRKAVHRATPPSPAPRDRVQAQSQTLRALSQEIAAALRAKASP